LPCSFYNLAAFWRLKFIKNKRIVGISIRVNHRTEYMTATMRAQLANAFGVWRALLAILVLAALALVAAHANQVPTTSAGTGPVTKTYVSGLNYQVSEVGANTAFFAPSAALNATGGITAAQLSPAISVTTNAFDFDVSAVGCPTTPIRCANRGSLTLNFNRTVTNPVIHISGIGGISGSAFYHTSFLLTSSNAATTPTLTRLAGNSTLTVAGNEIRSSTINGAVSCTVATPAACGSVRINGTFSTVTFQLDLLMGGSGAPTGADGWTMTTSVDEDFGDAPGSYDTTAAASHIVGGLFLGSSVTADNVATTNTGTLTPSPIANATASSDGGDNGVTFPTLIRGVSGGTIDVAVTGSGGLLQGWIDWADDGNHATVGDQIATNVADGGAGDTDGTVNGIIRIAVTPPVGAALTPTIARFRISSTSGLGPRGLASDGEVEDYEVTVLPQRADLSLTKTVSNPSPSNGTTISYTLTVTSAASPASTLTATGITVSDVLPAGVSFSSATGTGSYNNVSGVWTVGSLAPGTSAALTINAVVTATSGTITNIAQVTASSLPDPDSTPNNGVTSEDDYATVGFAVSSTLTAPVCTAGGTQQIISNGTFASGTGPSWTSWTAAAIWTGTNLASVSDNAVSGSLAQSGLSGLKFGPSATGGAVIQLSQWWRNGAPSAGSSSAQLTLTVAGTPYARITTDPSAGTIANVVYLNGASGNLSTLTEFASTGWRINLPTSVAATGAISFNFVPGGGAASDDFQVDNVTLYTCQPANLSVSKISLVLSDGVSTANFKAIPGATVQYCITISNLGTITASDLAISDLVPANMTYVPGTLYTGAGCGSATTPEDDNATDADETDPNGASVSGSTVTGTSTTLAGGSNLSLVFNTTID
jgi:uncharacterized repeat protein (TIGR01451 family)